MPYNHRRIDAEYWTATILFIIKSGEKFISYFLFERYHIKRFGHFQGHIARKAVGYIHISNIAEQVAAFNITNEVEFGSFFHQRISCLAKRISLLFLFPN